MADTSADFSLVTIVTFFLGIKQEMVSLEVCYESVVYFIYVTSIYSYPNRQLQCFLKAASGDISEAVPSPLLPPVLIWRPQVTGHRAAPTTGCCKSEAVP